jgi:hypothetical protein
LGLRKNDRKDKKRKQEASFHWILNFTVFGYRVARIRSTGAKILFFSDKCLLENENLAQAGEGQTVGLTSRVSKLKIFHVRPVRHIISCTFADP